MIESKTVILVGGPTASGKTSLAIELAQKYNGVIINADSMQVYQELDIITARPNEHECQQAEHQVFGFISIKQHFSVAQWLEKVSQTIQETQLRKKTPILVGGTGLYFKALIEGLSPIPSIDMAIRKKIGNYYDEIGAQKFHDELHQIDPQAAERLSANDRQRCIRAMEIWHQTGQTLTYWQNQPRKKFVNNAVFKTFILLPNREKLYQKIEKRFDFMIENGALDEAKHIKELNLDRLLPGLKAVGLTSLLDYLDKKISLDEAITTGKTQTRRYAKRQFTWFKNQLPEQETKKLSVWHLKPPVDIKILDKYLQNS